MEALAAAQNAAVLQASAAQQQAQQNAAVQQQVQQQQRRQLHCTLSQAAIRASAQGKDIQGLGTGNLGGFDGIFCSSEQARLKCGHGFRGDGIRQRGIENS